MLRGPIPATLAVIAILMITAGVTLAQPASPADSPPPADPAAYCESVGGQVQLRAAFFGTNADQSQWIDLGRTLEVCRFQADDEARSRIYVDLVTLASATPTLASVAYLAMIEDPDLDPAQGNPATQACSHLGGSSSFGTGASGGGWVELDDPVDVVVQLCLFPDGSAIDEWGIAYHSGGVVRGADLAPLFAWQEQEPLPDFFPPRSSGS